MPIIDLHCDTIWKLMDEGEQAGLHRNAYSVDVEKLQAGQVAAQFFALFVDKEKTTDPLARAMSMAERFFRELKQNEANIGLTKNHDELLANLTDGKISAFLTIEEGGALAGSLVNLERFYHLGVRLITLTWNYPNELGYPNCRPEYSSNGLTPFGRDVVAAMNQLGMLVDVSHLSDGGFWDVARLAATPFVASHSNARALAGHPRNLTDEMIRILAEKGGVMGLNFEKRFLGDPYISRVADMVRHIQHIRKVGGIEVIAIGSDFDGIGPELELAHADEFYKLIDALAAGGFSQDEIEKICWQNAYRVIRDTLK